MPLLATNSARPLKGSKLHLVAYGTAARRKPCQLAKKGYLKHKKKPTRYAREDTLAGIIISKVSRAPKHIVVVVLVQTLSTRHLRLFAHKRRIIKPDVQQANL